MLRLLTVIFPGACRCPACWRVFMAKTWFIAHSSLLVHGRKIQRI
jgi:hypothetical protein